MIKATTKGAFVTALVAVLLLPFSSLRADIPVGQWKLYPAYNDATKCCMAFGQVFVLSDGSLYSYCPQKDENSVWTYDKNLGLSDCDIRDIAYCRASDALILVYYNGNIDLLYQDQTIVNCPDIMLGNPGEISIGTVLVDGVMAYIPIGCGVVVFNTERREISNFYRFDMKVSKVLLTENKIVVLGSNSIVSAGRESNLLDPENWKKDTNYKIGNFTDSTVICNDSIVTVRFSADSCNSYKLLYPTVSATLDGHDLWACHGVYGLAWYRIDGSEISCKATLVKPDSPRRNWFHSISWPSKERMLAVGGCHNYSGIEWPGTVMIYEDGKWSYLQENISDITGHKYIDLTEAAQDPADPNHIFVGSARQGLYEFKDGKFVKNHTWDNSGLKNIIENNKYDYVSASSLRYDEKGNLWMTNNEVDTIIKILMADGSWKGLYYPELAGQPTMKQMTVDSEGRIWLISSRGSRPGIACIDINGTITDNSDDKIKFSGYQLTNQDGKTADVWEFYQYGFDLDGDMWICTSNGIFVLREPENFLSTAKPVFERIKISRNDGTDLADYLFEGACTTAMYIDQGNRKWIGTLDNGVFLLSADGTETIQHFTAENSPLPSNNIISITENAVNGSVFFGTPLGIAEYGGQARDPETSLSRSNMSVYPNPVLPGFEGFVTITGLTSECIVKITNSSGQIVYQNTSNGGSLSWNLCDVKGKQVPSGVYHAIAIDLNGNKSESVSITVIR